MWTSSKTDSYLLLRLCEYFATYDFCIPTICFNFESCPVETQELLTPDQFVLCQQACEPLPVCNRTDAASISMQPYSCLSAAAIKRAMNGIYTSSPRHSDKNTVSTKVRWCHNHGQVSDSNTRCVEDLLGHFNVLQQARSVSGSIPAPPSVLSSKYLVTQKTHLWFQYKVVTLQHVQ